MYAKGRVTTTTTAFFQKLNFSHLKKKSVIKYEKVCMMRSIRHSWLCTAHEPPASFLTISRNLESSRVGGLIKLISNEPRNLIKTRGGSLGDMAFSLKNRFFPCQNPFFELEAMSANESVPENN